MRREEKSFIIFWKTKIKDKDYPKTNILTRDKEKDKPTA
jgi:hypothetical protein